MADADLDVVIRQLARQLHTGLMTRAKQRRDHFNGLAAKAKSKEAGARFRMMAKATLEQAGAAARRLQISADNVADSQGDIGNGEACEKGGHPQEGQPQEGQGEEGQGGEIVTRRLAGEAGRAVASAHPSGADGCVISPVRDRDRPRLGT